MDLDLSESEEDFLGVLTFEESNALVNYQSYWNVV